jgi:hypothetical protein
MKRCLKKLLYRVELERILRCWLSQDISVITQHNIGGRKRCDIVITPSRDEHIVLELVVSESAKVIEEHFVSAREYADILNAKECWVFSRLYRCYIQVSLASS